MTKSLALIRAWRQGEEVALDQHPWLRLLVEAEERQINLEHFASLAQVAAQNPVLDYVERTLTILSQQGLSFWMREVLEQVLIWSEAAKGGTYRERKALLQSGVNLQVHNVGSAEIYRRHHPVEPGTSQELIHTLILTHGLAGQHLRGEVPLSRHRPLTALVERGVVGRQEMRALLLALNHCVIGGVSQALWAQVGEPIAALADAVAAGDYSGEPGLKERLRRLRSRSIACGEDFDSAYDQAAADPTVVRALERLAEKELWYVEPALSDFSLEEFLQILLFICAEPTLSQTAHINFEPVMKALYYDYNGQKRVNLFRKRVIEHYLREPGMHDQPHVRPELQPAGPGSETLFFQFRFTPVAEALIQFCLEAERSGTKYQQAILLLYDFFGFRRDQYDRFHNESTYLADMNRSGDQKRVMLQYVVGDTVLDVGPGGGIMLDLIEEVWPEKRALGIDIAANVIEALRRKKHAEGRRWDVVQGDALNLKEYLAPGSVGTVLFSSVLHELYSYIPYQGRKFSLETVAAALRSAYDILPPGGRIIIRDGVMTEPEAQEVIVRFLAEEGMRSLRRYCEEFRGRPVTFAVVGQNEVRMRVNDAMEFLYTYTWGDEAFPHEVQEQFGYLTPSGWERFVREQLGSEAELLVNSHYLQEGYTLALSPKIEFFDAHRRPIPLPDSTCLIVIEKRG